MDQAKNFAKGTVIDGIETSDTSLTLESGHGGRFPDVPFNAVIWNATDYPDPSDDPNVEILRVTAKSTDTFTIVRGQEGTFDTEHVGGGKTYFLVAGLTAKVLTEDLQFGITADLVGGTITLAQDATGWAIDRDAGMTIIGDTGNSFNGTRIEVDDDNSRIDFFNQAVFPNLPSSDPHIVGALYRDGSNNIKWSAG